MTPALAYILQMLNMMPVIIATGQSVMGLVNTATIAVQNMAAEKRDPTPAEWDALNLLLKSLHDKIQAG